MTIKPIVAALTLSLMCGTAFAASAPAAPVVAPSTAPSTVYVGKLGGKFDPDRVAANDLTEAISQAKAQNKRIIMDVGGEWCVWCLRMDKFMQGNEMIRNTVAKDYVWLKVNYSDENKNEAFLSQYPKVKGYPHLFVLDADGKLLQSENTGELEQDKSYNAEKLLAFLQQWSGKGSDK
jgi:thiol:disulfide interchange protein